MLRLSSLRARRWRSPPPRWRCGSRSAAARIRWRWRRPRSVSPSPAYTATSGLSLYPRAGAAQAPALSPDLLAVLVAIVAFLISGGFLLLLLPERVPQSSPQSSQATVAVDPAAAPPAT